MNFWLVTFSATAFLTIVQSFITVWVGEEYLLNIFIVIILTLNYYQKMMRSAYDTFKESAGIWYEDKNIPIIESLINIIASIVLLKIIGIAGIFLGTIISGLVIWFYSYPKFVYSKIFDRSYKSFFYDNLRYFIIFIIITTVSFFISLLIKNSNIFINLIYNAIIGIFLPNILLFCVYHKTDKYKYFKEILKKLFKKILGVLKNEK